MRVLLFWLVILIQGTVVCQETRVIYPRPQSEADERHQFRVALLQLALEQTKQSDGPFKIELSEGSSMTQAKVVDALTHRQLLDVVALPTNKEREDKLLPIRIPILKGLLGYRLFLINQADQEKFKAIQTLADLKKFQAGLSFDWADKSIYAYNQLPVVTGSNYESLFGMLALKRFDYFPRGVNEIWNEIEQRNNTYPNMVVEQTLALHYPFVVYFFTNKENKTLADRIERGLKLALKSGEFDQLFLKFHGDYLKKAKLSNRRLIEIENPDLPSEARESLKTVRLEL